MVMTQTELFIYILHKPTIGMWEESNVFGRNTVPLPGCRPYGE